MFNEEEYKSRMAKYDNEALIGKVEELHYKMIYGTNSDKRQEELEEQHWIAKQELLKRMEK